MTGIPKEDAQARYWCHTCRCELAPSSVAAEVHAREGCEVVDLAKDGLPIGGKDPRWHLRRSILADGSPVYDVTCGPVTFYAIDRDTAMRLIGAIRGCVASRIL